AGLRSQVLTGLAGGQTTTYPDGTVVSTTLGPDPRWGMRAPVAASRTVRAPSGKVQTTITQRTATLATAGDVLSLRALGQTTTVNGQPYTSAYDAASRT